MPEIAQGRDRYGEAQVIEGEDPRLGRIRIEDERDEEYPLSRILSAPGIRFGGGEGVSWNYHWPLGWWGNQGYTPQCVAYACMHWAEDGPRTRRPFQVGSGPVLDCEELYRQAQQIDRWPGEGYSGTSIRAGVKVMQNHGLVREYLWAQSFVEVIDALLTEGPLIFGAWWSREMMETDEDGFLHVNPSDQWVGGHAWVANGINLDRAFIRCKNSWGREWGDDGYFRLTLADAEYLFTHGGEACMPIPKGGR